MPSIQFSSQANSIVICAQTFAALWFSANSTWSDCSWSGCALTLKANLRIPLCVSGLTNTLRANRAWNSFNNLPLLFSGIASHFGVMVFAKPNASLWKSANLAFYFRSMSLGVGFLIDQFKVFNSVVRSIVIYVMHKLRSNQFSFNKITHYHSMLKNVSILFALNVLWAVDNRVALVVSHTK